MSDKYRSIVAFYEGCFDKHGDSPKGHDWPVLADLISRYEVMLGVIQENCQNPTLLDFGCGTAMFYEHIQETRKNLGIKYNGLDLGPKFIEMARRKHPHIDFYCFDVLKSPERLKSYDYMVFNGVFTEKIDLTFEEMFSYFRRILKVIFPKILVGFAFNVMAKHVEWEKENLFHLPLDMLAEFLVRDLTRNFVIRNDYGLYEYTVYVYK
tara:strand:- start:1164 stop:1790 length:627 start_codon:yes stop_codon:yes gene_type:complete